MSASSSETALGREAPAEREALAQREAREGESHMARGDALTACGFFERAVALCPSNAQWQCQLGSIEWRLGRPTAGARFERAIEARPNFAMAHAALASWCLQNNRVADADSYSARAVELAPADGAVLQSRAAALEVTGDLAGAWGIVCGLVQRGYVPMPVVRLYGRMARYQGQAAEALHVVEHQLAGTKGSTHDRARLHLTAADLLDALGRYDQAFAHAQIGNKLVAPLYDRKTHERTFDSFIAHFTRERLSRLARSAETSDQPVFIVGMPRSGTSLVEQILASHPQVHGAGELELMTATWAETVRLLGARADAYPDCLDTLTPELATTLAQSYLAPLTAAAPRGATRITDKLPLNFLHLGLISLLLPNARIIDCRRDPRDTCLSCYMALFEAGNDFKHDLANTAHFYLQHQRLMAHWRAALSLPILTVSYESVVANPEVETRRMLEFLGLPWDDRCLSFHKTNRPVTSSSRQQVRQPLYASSVGRWKNYARHLGELDKWFPAQARTADQRIDPGA
jgi:tetratricopeptide (TPR) repeat protein